MSAKDNAMMSTEEANKKIDPKKLEKQRKFEEKQAKLVQQKVETTEKKEKPIKPEKPKLEIQEDNVMPEMSLEEALLFKKDLSKMRDKYEPKLVESHWYQHWCNKNYFTPTAEEALANPEKKRFTILFPPPSIIYNADVTGSLHIGHGLTFAVQDSLVRYYRMNGYITEFTPGTDHAGIATQTVVEKQIWKNEKKTRYDYGREAFLKKVWEWKQSYGERILMQGKRLGASFDWDRLFFTMDQNLTVAVKEAFVTLHERELIYRANRLVNWSCQMKTAISDIEVEKMDLSGPTQLSIPSYEKPVLFGVIHSFAYPVISPPVDGPYEIVVATTRLETMLGDTAVAVHSKDPRYAGLIGKFLQHPFLDRQIPIIVDDILVDMNYGTGAVKITPAHDPNDFECGQRHHLPMINILTDNGCLNEHAGKFSGMKRFDVRQILELEMKSLGIYRGVEKNPMVLSLCSRSKDVIEPLIRQQWYVKCSEIAEVMIQKVESKELKLIPEDQEKVWAQWMGGMRDWCISRQIWWGHQCPAYQVRFIEEEQKEREGRWIVARSFDEALQKAVTKFNKKAEDIILTQDEDVLDTWFSSALLPFSAFGWPNTEHKDFKAFFPNSILETGGDILFFWVARMAMMSYLLCEKLPFHTVYLHPIIRDALGRKMSKSLGNVIDPLEIIDGCSLQHLIDKIIEGNLDPSEQQRSIQEKKIEFPNGIPECGSDALRFSLLCYLTQNRSINLDLKRIIGYRNFCNKIWQSYKFVTSRFSEFSYNADSIHFSSMNLINQWILVKLNCIIDSTNKSFVNFCMADASNGFYQFWVHDFCDIYIESTKFIFQDNNADLIQETLTTLFLVLETGLRVLHPMMPFLTEELYQKLPAFKGKYESLCIAEYPQYRKEWDNAQSVAFFESIQNIAQKCRSLTNSVNLPVKVKPDMYFVSNNPQYKLQDFIIRGLTRANNIIYNLHANEVPRGCVAGNLDDVSIFISVIDHINIEQEVTKLDKKLQDLEKQIQNSINKMSIKDYETKTPDEIKKTNQEKLDAQLKDQQTLSQQIQDMKNL